MKRARIIFLLAFIAIIHGNSYGQLGTFYLNTGYNNNASTTYADGAADAYWTVTSDPDNQTTEPRTAYAIPTNSAWSSPFTNSKWIGPYPTDDNNLEGVYAYEYPICITQNFIRGALDSIYLFLQIRADDSARVYVNGTFVLSTEPATSGYKSYDDPNPPSVIVPKSLLLSQYPAIVKVEVSNVSGLATGFNMEAYVVYGSMYTPGDCARNRSIQGMKWNDMDGDGVKDAEEPGLQGWQITIDNTSTTYTAVTDVLGNYYFMNLPAGTWTVSETNQTGWTQTYPAAGTYTTTPGLYEAIVGKDFGNFDNPELPCANCIGSFAPEADKTYLISTWVKEENASPTKLSYDRPTLTIEYPSISSSTSAFVASGTIIDGWQRLEQEFTIPSNATDINIKLNCLSGNCFFDDIRIYPTDGSMKTYVYDPVTLRLVAELDEKNYATIYEYDEEGKLIRVKKETERGIMTIQENKNNTKKQ